MTFDQLIAQQKQQTNLLFSLNGVVPKSRLRLALRELFQRHEQEQHDFKKQPKAKLGTLSGLKWPGRAVEVRAGR